MTLWYLSAARLKSSPMPVPSAVMMERNSSLAKHLIQALFLRVERLAAQRQNRLKPPVAPLLGAAARAESPSTMNSSFCSGLRPVQLDSLPTSGAASSALLCARHVAGLARGLAHLRRPHRLFDDLLGQLLMLQVLEIRRQLLREDRLHQRAHLGIAQLALGLALELRVFHHRQHHGGHALAEVVAAQIRVLVLERAQPCARSRSSPWCRRP